MTTDFVLQENVALAPLTSLGIGGPARYFVRAHTEESVIAAVRFAEDRRLAVFVLGGGSNVLISDDGFRGVVVQISINGICNEEPIAAAGPVRLHVGAGENWDDFVAHCVERDLAGIECLSGIPGSVGGTPVQNVGAYGQEVSETIHSVRCFDTRDDKIVTLSNATCGFSYRTSIFNSTERGRYIVLSVLFELVKGGPPKVTYKDLVEHFAGRSPSLAELRETVLEIRRAKSMVIETGDPNAKSAGSFFKNPIVSTDRYQEIAQAFGGVPHFKFGEMIKIPAAWLIELAGFHKGFKYGGAGISTKHTLALINRNGATAEEVLELKRMIQAAVVEKFGIALEPEPVFVGFSVGRT